MHAWQLKEPQERLVGLKQISRNKVLGQDARGVTSHTMQGLVSHCKELAYIQDNESHCRVLCGEVPRSNLCFKQECSHCSTETKLWISRFEAGRPAVSWGM